MFDRIFKKITKRISQTLKVQRRQGTRNTHTLWDIQVIWTLQLKRQGTRNTHTSCACFMGLLWEESESPISRSLRYMYYRSNIFLIFSLINTEKPTFVKYIFLFFYFLFWIFLKSRFWVFPKLALGYFAPRRM